MQYLTFRLSDVAYAVDVRIVETVVQYEGSTGVPSPLPYMRGVMDLRGRVVPLIDLRKKLGLPALDELDGTSVIVFGVRGDETGQGDSRLTVGAIVDGVSEVLTLDDASVEMAKGEGMELWERYVDGVARHESGMIVILRPEGLFSIEEITALRVA